MTKAGAGANARESTDAIVMEADNFRQALDRGADILAEIGIDTPRLDATLLLQGAAGLDKAELIIRERDPIEKRVKKRFADFLAKRMGRQSVHRILGEREFYGLRLRITPAVLEPRPETECLVDAVLDLLRARGGHGKAWRFADLGTGSGALALALLSRLPKARALATDISEAALDIARRNAIHHGLDNRLETCQGSWTEALVASSGAPSAFDFLVSNPPYIAASRLAKSGRAQPEIFHDPPLALNGGADGLDAFRALLADSAPHIAPDGFFALEMGYNQKDALAALCAQEGWRIIDFLPDLNKLARIIIIQK